MTRPRRAPARRQADLWWQCDGQVREWEAAWLNEPFYLESKAWYDDNGSRGIINPPWSIWGSLCPSPTLPSSSRTAEAATTTSSTGSTSSVALVSPTPSPTPSSLVSSTAATLASATRLSIDATTSVTSASSLSAQSTRTTSQSILAQLTATPITPLAPTLAPANPPGGTQWDWQTKGTMVAVVVAIVVGALLWGLWAILRCRFKGVYAPRSWFLPPGSRPQLSTTAATLTPFLHLPPLDAPASDAQVMTHVIASALAIAVLSAVVGLGIFLPLSIADVPHLTATTLPNPRGGRLGSMTNLSLLRLLNALDPVPELPTAQLRLLNRLPSTIEPALASARPRLIAILVIVAIIWVGGTLFIVWRTYTKFAAYAKRFDIACDRQSMVFIPASKATAWQGLSETGIKRRLLMGPTDEGSVAGVFAIGKYDGIKEQTRERAHVLDVLEEAEAQYIQSFLANPTTVGPHPNTSSNHLSPGHKIGSTSSARSSVSTSQLAAQMADFDPPGASGSAFLEVKQRSSVLRKSGRLHIGEEIVQDEDGTFLPATKSSHDEGVVKAHNRESYQSAASDSIPPIIEYQPLTSRPQSALVPSAVADLKAKIAWTRSRLRKLSASIDMAQQNAMKDLATGNEVVGWIIVGRGVCSLPFAQCISGRAKEDIIWENLAILGSRKAFWGKVVGTGAIIAVVFFAQQTKPVTYSELSFVTLKGTVYLLLIVGTAWLIALGAILFGVDAYVEKSQKARAVGDGVTFISWLILILVINLCIIVPAVMVLQPRRLIKRILQRRKAVTPRQKFHLNQPSNYHPAGSLAPLLTGMFYLSALCGIFPIVTVPVLILAYLSLVGHQWVTSNVLCVTRGGMPDGSIALWVVRRLGWAASLQPLVFGLVLLCRREWALGGAGIGIAVLALAASEFITVGLHRRKPLSCFASTSLIEDDTLTTVSSEERQIIVHKRHDSDHSILAAVHTLLPSLGRLPADNPLPFPTDAIDDYVSTERAMHATPETAVADVFGVDVDSVVITGPADPSRGLIYPPELLQPAPTVWLPHGEASVAQHEADALLLEGHTAVVDPVRAKS